MEEKILVIDSDSAVRARLQSMLTAHGYTVAQADSCGYSAGRPRQAAWMFVIIGYQLDDGSGLDLLDVVQERVPGAAIILIGDRRQATALSALRHGADDYVPAPVHEADLLAALQRAARAARSRLAICPNLLLPPARRPAAGKYGDTTRDRRTCTRDQQPADADHRPGRDAARRPTARSPRPRICHKHQSGSLAHPRCRAAPTHHAGQQKRGRPDPPVIREKVSRITYHASLHFVACLKDL